MIDLSSGHVAYAVLSFGGILGIGDKLFAVPFLALRLNADEEYFELNVEKEQLEKGLGFDPNDWPDIADLDWQRDVHTVYGVDPFWER